MDPKIDTKEPQKKPDRRATIGKKIGRRTLIGGMVGAAAGFVLPVVASSNARLEAAPAKKPEAVKPLPVDQLSQNAAIQATRMAEQVKADERVQLEIKGAEAKKLALEASIRKELQVAQEKGQKISPAALMESVRNALMKLPTTDQANGIRQGDSLDRIFKRSPVGQYSALVQHALLLGIEDVLKQNISVIKTSLEQKKLGLYFGKWFKPVINISPELQKLFPKTDSFQFDAVAVLGAGVRTMSLEKKELLAEDGARGRAAAGAAAWMNGEAPALVLCGNKGNIPGLADAQAMKRFLLDPSVQQVVGELPSGVIVPESLSNSTAENIINLNKIAKENGWENVLIITEKYHTERAQKDAKRMGINAKVVSMEEVLANRFPDLREALQKHEDITVAQNRQPEQSKMVYDEVVLSVA